MGHLSEIFEVSAKQGKISSFWAPREDGVGSTAGKAAFELSDTIIDWCTTTLNVVVTRMTTFPDSHGADTELGKNFIDFEVGRLEEWLDKLPGLYLTGDQPCAADVIAVSYFSFLVGAEDKEGYQGNQYVIDEVTYPLVWQWQRSCMARRSSIAAGEMFDKMHTQWSQVLQCSTAQRQMYGANSVLCMDVRPDRRAMANTRRIGEAPYPTCYPDAPGVEGERALLGSGL